MPSSKTNVKKKIQFQDHGQHTSLNMTAVFYLFSTLSSIFSVRFWLISCGLVLKKNSQKWGVGSVSVDSVSVPRRPQFLQIFLLEPRPPLPHHPRWVFLVVERAQVSRGAPCCRFYSTVMVTVRAGLRHLQNQENKQGSCPRAEGRRPEDSVFFGIYSVPLTTAFKIQMNETNLLKWGQSRFNTK